MARSEAWILGGLLGVMWALPIWMSSTPPDLCKALKSLKYELNATKRRHYMKHNFPINYTMRVHYEEVFRLSNISRLRKDEEVENEFLQELWINVNHNVLKKVEGVLPERHPTRRKYLTNLATLFRKVEELKIPDEQEKPESIEEILGRLSERDYEGWKYVTPKSLLDNCYRTMHCLFRDCFSSEEGAHDYCNKLHWRKGKTTALPKTTSPLQT